jgi:hypothetical protein
MIRSTQILIRYKQGLKPETGLFGIKETYHVLVVHDEEDSSVTRFEEH